MANRFVLNNISYHGAGAIKEIPGELTRRGFSKAFVATDADLVRFGVTKKVTDLLDEAGIAWEMFSNIKPNPTIENVQAGVAAFKASGADCIVAVGGGSAMDTAKGIGIIATNPKFADVVSLEGVAPTAKHAVFTIAVPTTAGTAAEVTINYVIADTEKERKFVCVDVNDIPEVAIVDPEMMATMPASLTAATGMDALTHAIEGYTTKGAWELSDMFHLKAIELISKNLRNAVAEAKSGVPASGREGMALAQYVAGMGFSNMGLGIDHSMAHTLSAHYDTPHGVACAMLLPIAMEFNKPVVVDRLADVARAMGVDTAGMSTEEAADAAIAAVRQLSEDVEIPKTCAGLVEDDLEQLACDAMADACFPGNPREADHDQVVELFRKIMAQEETAPVQEGVRNHSADSFFFSMYSDAHYSLRLARSFSSRQISSYISSITLCGTSPKK